MENRLKSNTDAILAFLQFRTIYSSNKEIVSLCNNAINVNNNYMKMIEEIITKMEEHSKCIDDRIKEELSKND